MTPTAADCKRAEMIGGAGAAERYGFGARIGMHCAAAVAVLLVLLPGLHDVPVSRDEVVYQGVVRRVTPWLRQLASDPLAAVSDEGVRRGWEFNHEHPGMARLLSAGSNVLLGGWTDPLVALRFGNALLAVVLVFDVFHFLRRRYDRTAAVFAVLSLLLLPPLYGHACIAAMDFPTAAFCLLASTAFVRGTERRGWAVVFGIWMGLALNSKINAAFVPVPLLCGAGSTGAVNASPTCLRCFLLAPLVWIATWPWLWHATLDRLIEYVQFHRQHLQANAVYFGADLSA